MINPLPEAVLVIVVRWASKRAAICSTGIPSARRS